MQKSVRRIIIISSIIFFLLSSFNAYMFLLNKQLKNDNLAYSVEAKEYNSSMESDANETKTINTVINDLNNIDVFINNKRQEYYNNIKELEQKIINGETNRKIVYITFDDGPYYLTTNVLETLKQYDVLATFFTIGSGKSRCYDNSSYDCTTQYEKIVAGNHTIANHTYSHGISNGLYSSVDSFMYQIDVQENLIKEKTGAVTNITRFPGGSSTAGWKKNGIIEKLREKGYGWVDWTASDGDGGNISGTNQAWSIFTNSIGEKIEVLLLHDYSYISYSLLPQMIEYLRNNGYELYPLFYDSVMINK